MTPPSGTTATGTGPDLTGLTDRALHLLAATVNTEHAAASARMHEADTRLAAYLTERIVRLLTRDHPTAALLFTRPGADYHLDETGHTRTGCTGHHHRLIPFELADQNGVVLTGFDRYTPVAYLTERITAVLGTREHVLDLDTRQWTPDVPR